ncbi:MAG: PQQ-binding-like beta-propeller repeat protein [Spirochaetaceae bacterium]|jgi:outer membrane protein assembly factor BamB|nr:PQQ-binding-like beta-propeller repeat protein [Spirochaetaceae bacterium]
MRYYLPVYIFIVLTAALSAQSTEEIENSLLWRQALGGSVIATPSAQVQSVALVLDGGLVRAYSDSGRQLWEYAAGGRLLPFISRSTTGMTFFGRTNGILYALNRSGRFLWDKRLGEPLAYAPLIGWDGRVFVFLSKKIICFTATGSQLWEYTTEAALSVQPIANTKGGFITVLKNNTLLLASAFGDVQKIELASAPTALLPGTYPNAVVLYDDGDIEAVKDGVSAKKIAKAEKTNIQTARIGGRAVTAAQYKQYAAVLLDTGNIVLWSLNEERALWTKPAMLGINRARLIFDERGIYLFSMSGAAGWTLEGSLLWNMRLQGASMPPVLSDDGILYYGGNNWLLFAYKVEHRSRDTHNGAQANTPQALFNLPDEGNYGLGAPAQARSVFFDGGDIDFTLKQIARGIKSGNVGTGEQYAFRALLALAGGGDDAVRPQLIQRLEALRLLGLIGSREVVPFLVHRLSAETDPNIKAGIIEALGRIGVDPNFTVLPLFERITAQAVDSKNQRLLSALSEALGRLCRFSGPPLSENGVKILVTIAGCGLPAAASASKELEILLK